MQRIAGEQLTGTTTQPLVASPQTIRFAAWPDAFQAKDTVQFGSGLVGTPPKPEKKGGGFLKTLVILAIGATGGYFYGSSGKDCVEESPLVTAQPAPNLTEETPEARETAPVVERKPTNPDSLAIYHELNTPHPDLAVIASHLENGGELDVRINGGTVFAKGIMRAAALENQELADFLLARANKDLLSFRTRNGMNLLTLLSGRDSTGGVAIFQKTLDAMKAAGVEDIAKPDVYDWHLAHALAFHGNAGALRLVIADTDTFGDPKVYLNASTKPYDNGQEGRTKQVIPGKTPLQMAQAELESTVEGSNIAVDKKKVSLCEGDDIPAENQAECAELKATLAAAAERIQAERGRLEDTIRLIQETLA